jgi:hypothetical protein
MKDFYYILGTNSNATLTEIDAAYQKLARKLQADEDEQDEFMNAHFREITEAYDILRDSRRRSKYDAAVKKNQNRQLAVFKLKYINIAVAMAFLAITALFAVYVIRAIQGHVTGKTVQKQVTEQPLVTTTPKKHHKAAMHILPKHLSAKDTAIKQQPQTVAPVIVTKVSADSTDITTVHANITGIVYLHQSPDYNSAVLAKIPDAAKVHILEKGPVYYKVAFNTQTGYVLKSAFAGH